MGRTRKLLQAIPASFFSARQARGEHRGPFGPPKAGPPAGSRGGEDAAAPPRAPARQTPIGFAPYAGAPLW
jgi:hypothetical protein